MQKMWETIEKELLQKWRKSSQRLERTHLDSNMSDGGYTSTKGGLDDLSLLRI